MSKSRSFVVWFSEIDKNDITTVGSKGANLGEMTHARFPIPNGFIVTTDAYSKFLREQHLHVKIQQLLSTVSFERPDSLGQVSMHIKKLILNTEISQELINDIANAYRKLSGLFKDSYVVVSTSITTGEVQNATPIEKQSVYDNIKGETNLILKIKEGWASLFDPQSILSRHEHKRDHFKVGTAMIIQKMIEAEQSGNIFTIDPTTNDKSKIIIEATLGLRRNNVKATHDQYELNKQTLEIISKQTHPQSHMRTRVKGKNIEVKVSSHESEKQKLKDNQIKELAGLGQKIENHYYFPQEIEWAIENKQIHILQTRPITTTGKYAPKTTDSNPSENLLLLLKGIPVSPGLASGPVKIIHHTEEIENSFQGDIVVVTNPTTEQLQAMNKAAAIILTHGEKNSQIANTAKELGIPTITGVEKATDILKPYQIITVNGTSGEIYKGATHLKPTTTKQSESKTATKIYLNLAETFFNEKSNSVSFDGIGLLQAEAMIKNIGIHPKQLLQEGKQKIYVDKLAEQIGHFCSKVNPQPVIYRASDLKSSEYRELKHGKEYELIETNPILGYRGAHRHILNPDLFELELEAVKKVRDTMDLKNLWLMLPFVRSIKELIQIKQIITSVGLHRSPSFKLWLMVAIPSNVILIDKFIEVGIDGVMIDAKDLTSLILGTDKENSEVSREHDELNQAVLWAFEHTIKTAHKHGITSSFCNQSPDIQPLLLEKLISWGITSITVSPNQVGNTREDIAKIERELISNHGKN